MKPIFAAALLLLAAILFASSRRSAHVTTLAPLTRPVVLALERDATQTTERLNDAPSPRRRAVVASERPDTLLVPADQWSLAQKHVEQRPDKIVQRALDARLRPSGRACSIALAHLLLKSSTDPGALSDDTLQFLHDEFTLLEERRDSELRNHQETASEPTNFYEREALHSEFEAIEARYSALATALAQRL